ncbi:MAG TPA: class IV adenylate cyclase [Candidatus Acidoferrales bacterium]|nr:class IV adenylate cyclase [Candidatus Acidoferrales bacterium]
MHIHREVEIKCRVEDIPAFRRKLKRTGILPVKPVWRLSAKTKKGRAGEPRVREMNYLFDTPQGGLAKHGQLLRIRIENEDQPRAKEKSGSSLRTILTYKGPAMEESATRVAPAASPGGSAPLDAGLAGDALQFVSAGRHKVREEIEVEAAEPAALAHILEALGMRAWFRYEKFRTTYRFPATARWATGLLIELDETPIGAFVELEGPPEAIDRSAKLLGFTPKDYITRSYLELYLAECRARGVAPAHMVFSPEK